jgi:hypothetical protein
LHQKIIYDSHTLSLYIMVPYLTKTLKKEFEKNCRDWDLNFRPLEHKTSTLPLHHEKVIHTWIKSSHSKFRTSIAFRVCNPYKFWGILFRINLLFKIEIGNLAKIFSPKLISRRLNAVILWWVVFGSMGKSHVTKCLSISTADILLF